MLIFAGSISISWLRVNGSPSVLHIEPFDGKELGYRSINCRITDLGDLNALYPNIPKRDAFPEQMVGQENGQIRKTVYIKAKMCLTLVMSPDIL